jgi:hypothetical protein
MFALFMMGHDYDDHIQFLNTYSYFDIAVSHHSESIVIIKCSYYILSMVMQASIYQ